MGLNQIFKKIFIYFLRQPKFWFTAIKLLHNVIMRLSRKGDEEVNASTHKDDKKRYRSKQRAIEAKKTRVEDSVCIKHEAATQDNTMQGKSSHSRDNSTVFNLQGIIKSLRVAHNRQTHRLLKPRRQK